MDEITIAFAGWCIVVIVLGIIHILTKDTEW